MHSGAIRKVNDFRQKCAPRGNRYDLGEVVPGSMAVSKMEKGLSTKRRDPVNNLVHFGEKATNPLLCPPEEGGPTVKPELADMRSTSGLLERLSLPSVESNLTRGVDDDLDLLA